MSNTIYSFHLQIPTIISPSKPSKQIENTRLPSTQQSSSPIPPTRQNGVSSPHNNSNSSKVVSPIYANTTSQPLSPQPPPVPAKPKYRSPNAQFAPINGDNYPTPKQSQNGFEVEEVSYRRRSAAFIIQFFWFVFSPTYP